MDQKIRNILEEAEDHLSSAESGLAKPKDDVVPYGICKEAHRSVIGFLSAFLMWNGRELPESMTVEGLLAACRETDSRFQDLHLSPFYSPTETEDVWMNPDTANDFVAMARHTGDMVTRFISDESYSINKADEFFRTLQKGLSKPRKDIVPFTICSLAENVVIHLLGGYLIQHGRDLPDPVTAERLLSTCKESDQQFEDIDLGSFYLPNTDQWVSPHVANDYAKTAERLRELVYQSKIQN